MPVAIADNNGPICNGQMIQLYGSTSTSGTTITYAWAGPNGYISNQQNPTDATVAGTYTLVVTVDNCASSPINTNVIFSTPPDAVASNGGPYCVGEIIQLYGQTNTPGSDTTYTWTGPNGFASSNQNPSGNLEPGLYQLVINVDGCNSIASSTDVIVHPSPQPMISGQDTICMGNSTTLDGGSGFTGYQWTDGSNASTLEVFTSGLYSVTVTDINNCTGVSSFQVTQVPSLTPVLSGSLAFCEGSQTMLDAGPGFTSYLWSSGEPTQVITVNSGNLYTVTVTDADGCTGSASVTTIMHPNPNVMIGGSSTYCIGGYTVLDAGAGYSVYQ
jgi:hypothetical protein